MHRRYKVLLFYIILFGLIFLIFEGSSYYILNKLFANRGLVYSTIAITHKEYDAYFIKKDPELGWLHGKTQIEECDAIGSRFIPSFPDPGGQKSCVSIYGDSYTWSNRTTPEEAWSNQLSILLGCRVSNFGVTGYGTDQAYLRFLMNEQDSARIIILNHFVFDIFRNVNQHWGTRITSETHKFMFKPRFIIDENGALDIVKVPDLSYDDMLKLQKKPEVYLKHEYFLPNGHYGNQILKFPYTLVLLRTIFLHTKFRSLFKGEPTHAPYYKKDHPSNSLSITAKIMEAFHDSVLIRKKTPVITIIPFSNDIDYYRKNGEWCYQNLIDLMEEKNIEVLNIGEKLIELLNDGDHNFLYEGEGHFNVQGDKVLAKIIYNHLKNKKLLKI